MESERLLGKGIKRERERGRDVDTIGFSEHVACDVLLLVQTGGTVNQNPCQ